MRVEPVEGVNDLSDLMAWVTAEAVGLARKAHESGLHFQEFERRVVLLGFGYGSAEVFIAGHQQSGRLHIFHQRNYRAFHVVVGVVPRIAGEPVFRAK